MPDSNEWLEQALRKAEPYIDNDDFSQEIMERLPARRRGSRISRRKGIVLLSGILGSLSSLPFLYTALGQPVVMQVLSTQWAVTVISMMLLALVALTSWWLLVVRE